MDLLELFYRSAGGKLHPPLKTSPKPTMDFIAIAKDLVARGQPPEGMTREEQIELQAAVDAAETTRILEDITGPTVKGTWARANPFLKILNKLRGENIKLDDWKRTHEAVELAICHILYPDAVLITTKEELADAPRPNGAYGNRIISVRRGTVVATTRINNFFTGNTSMRSDEEMAEVNRKISEQQKKLQPKGEATNNDKEKKAIDASRKLTPINDVVLESEDVIESRDKDEIIRVKKESDNDVDSNEKLYVSIQVKSSGIKSSGQSNLHIIVGEIRGQILDGAAVKLIIMDEDWKNVLVEFFLCGPPALKMLEPFAATHKIHMTPFATGELKSALYIALNDPKWRFDVSRGRVLKDGTVISTPANEIKRRDAAEITFAEMPDARLKSSDFWNFDMSQISSPSNRVEQEIFDFVKGQLAAFEVIAKKYVSDNYGPVDMRVILHNGDVLRTQSKTSTVCDTPLQDIFNMCSKNVPYNPVHLDSFDIFHKRYQHMFCLPARVLGADGKLVSYLSDEELMAGTVKLSDPWMRKHSVYRCDMTDLKGDNGVKKYIRLQKERAELRKMYA